MNQTDVATTLTSVIQQIIAAHTLYTLAVEQENLSTIDYATQDDPFLKIEIRLMSADQMDLADRPRVEQWGQLWLSAVCKAGTGTAKAKALLDFATPYFELKTLGGVHCQAVAAQAGKEIRGLWVQPAIVNFYCQRVI